MINYQNYTREIKQSINRVIKSKNFILDKEVQRLEKDLSSYFGIKYAIGINAGTDGLIYGLKALEIKVGDEVICPVFTFVGTAEAIVWTGARPVFADINPQTFNISIDSLKKLVTRRTKAIIPVHLYGQSAEMGEILKLAHCHKLKVIEDTAQAFGAEYKGKKVGTIGNLGCLSFFPSKILGAFGDGGMVLTNNSKLAKTIKMMRVNGAKRLYYDHQIIGGSSRLDEIQAAILQIKFKYLKQNIEHRQKIANQYNKILKGIDDLILPFVSRNNYHVYNYYTIKTPFRDRLKDFLTINEIKTSIFYPKPLHLLHAFKFLNYKSGDFPEAEKSSKEILSLPINEFLSLEKARFISNLIKSFFKKK